MQCRVIDCPFFDAGTSECGLTLYLNRPTERLVLASLDIGRALADRKRITFTVQGTCMYPCIRQGDILRVESVDAVNAKVGDVAVIRRGDTLLAHRIIDKGSDDRGAFIVTCPDRTSLGNDGPTHDEGLLGIVVQTERNGVKLSFDPIILRGSELFKVSVWEWWNWRAKPAIVNCVGHVQHLGLYRTLASAWLRICYPSPLISVRVPLNPRQKTDLHQLFPLSGFDLLSVRQQGGEVVVWTIQMELQKKVPAAWVTLVRRPECCPEGGGWEVWRSWCRSRYRGAGLQARLIDEARRILARSGSSLGRSADAYCL